MEKKIIIELKVVEVTDLGSDNYGKAKGSTSEENKIKLEVESYDKAEAKVAAFFKMLGL